MNPHQIVPSYIASHITLYHTVTSTSLRACAPPFGESAVQTYMEQRKPMANIVRTKRVSNGKLITTVQTRSRAHGQCNAIECA